MNKIGTVSLQGDPDAKGAALTIKDFQFAGDNPDQFDADEMRDEGGKLAIEWAISVLAETLAKMNGQKSAVTNLTTTSSRITVKDRP